MMGENKYNSSEWIYFKKDKKTDIGHSSQY